MAKKEYKEYFNYAPAGASSLNQSNLVAFDYRSAIGDTHDYHPFVYVLERRPDRIFGLNLHYDKNQLEEIVNNKQEEMRQKLYELYIKKYPAKRREIDIEEFDPAIIEKKDANSFRMRIHRRDLQEFLLNDQNVGTLRNYLFKRMKSVNKLSWKL